MKKKDALFLLIKSLSKSEKRYFALSFSDYEKGTKNYLLLFNAMDEQDVYNEKEIKKKFAKEIFIKQLNVTKLYLYKQVLKTLRKFHSESSIENKLLGIIQDVSLLSKKGLNDQCLEMIWKGKRIAGENEHFRFLSELLHWEGKIRRKNTESGLYKQQIQEILMEQTTAIEKEQNATAYLHLYIRMRLLNAKGGAIRNKSILNETNKLMRHKLLQSPDKALTMLSKSIFYDMYLFYYSFTGNVLQSYNYTFKKVQFLELKENENYVNGHQQEYLNALLTLCMLQAQLCKKDEFDSASGKVIMFLNKYPKLKTGNLIRLFICRTTLLYSTGEFNQAPLFINQAVKALAEYLPRIGKEDLITLYFNFSYLYFGKQDYKEALKWLNKLLNDVSTREFRDDIYCTARILNLVIYYEIGNNDKLELLTRSTYRFLLKRNHLYKFETSVIRFIRVQLPKVKSKKGHIESFEVLHKELLKLSKDRYEKGALQVFDFISWLESKIEKKSFADVVKSKANNLKVSK